MRKDDVTLHDNVGYKKLESGEFKVTGEVLRHFENLTVQSLLVSSGWIKQKSNLIAFTLTGSNAKRTSWT